jgi:hypothetical protein
VNRPAKDPNGRRLACGDYTRRITKRRIRQVHRAGTVNVRVVAPAIAAPPGSQVEPAPLLLSNVLSYTVRTPVL